MSHCIAVSTFLLLIVTVDVNILLSQIYTPNLPIENTPAFVAMKSSDNVPIESSWNHMRNYNGRDLKTAILMTKDADKRYFDPMNELHM